METTTKTRLEDALDAAAAALNEEEKAIREADRGRVLYKALTEDQEARYKIVLSDFVGQIDHEWARFLAIAALRKCKYWGGPDWGGPADIIREALALNEDKAADLQDILAPEQDEDEEENEDEEDGGI